MLCAKLTVQHNWGVGTTGQHLWGLNYERRSPRIFDSVWPRNSALFGGPGTAFPLSLTTAYFINTRPNCCKMQRLSFYNAPRRSACCFRRFTGCLLNSASTTSWPCRRSRLPCIHHPRSIWAITSLCICARNARSSSVPPALELEPRHLNVTRDRYWAGDPPGPGRSCVTQICS